jgi:hypothetical protein
MSEYFAPISQAVNLFEHCALHMASVDRCRLARGPLSKESPSAVGVRAGGMLVIMTRRGEKRREEE